MDQHKELLLGNDAEEGCDGGNSSKSEVLRTQYDRYLSSCQ